jgi:hypothetical protein
MTHIGEEIPMKTTLIAAAILLTLTLAWAGQPGPTPPNWGQADLPDGWRCEGPTSAFSEFFEVPGALSLSTGGNPVLLSVTVNMQHSPNFTTYGPGFQVMLVVDGQASSVPLVSRIYYGIGYEAQAVSATRLIPMGSGPHTVRVRIACQNPWVIIDGWLAAYELPTIPK